MCVCVCVKKPHEGEDRVPTLVGTLSFARLQFWARVRCIIYTSILVMNVDTAACVASVMSMLRFFYFFIFIIFFFFFIIFFFFIFFWIAFVILAEFI